MELTEDHLLHFLDHGYVVVPDFLDSERLQICNLEASAHLREWLEAPDDQAGRAVAYRDFPFVGGALNSVATDRSLLGFAARVLGRESVRLEQCHLLGTASAPNPGPDELLHVDYEDHNLLYPSRRRELGQICGIVYLTDVEHDSAPTFVVPSEFTDNDFLVPAELDRDTSPHYAREAPVIANAGSLLLFSMRTFHRGSTFRAPGNRRIVQFLNFGPQDAPWLGRIGWPKYGKRGAMRSFIAQADWDGLLALGIPDRDHPLWQEEELCRGVAARYPNSILSQHAETVLNRIH